MGWFDKKEKEKGIPSLPKLPKLPELPRIDDEIDYSDKPIHQLPSFPNSSFGEKFSQEAIKDAIAGEKESEEVFDPNEFAQDRMQMMEKPLTREIPEGFKDVTKKVRKIEPVFIRLDKFEESLQIFDETKSKILEIEKILRDIKEIKDDEERELSSWENEIQLIKKQIEKVDKEIFSRIE
ncbi:hypothetical protein CMI40_01120 [Candidatus Pacearchaeota archaeon]|jgi:hypothetical protein|nr:hypothetical protein [Candidatus Pacearchaeota archaeon]|tara:strand:+ start:9848 stop:10387 length:540 start_codon:yes stop_codon:yes gene_type:complete